MTEAVDEPLYDEHSEPLSLAIGHLVLGAALLERALLVDLIQRKVKSVGPTEVFGGGLMSRLERRPAGVLLGMLEDLGFEEELAGRIAAVIAGRNHFVHHLYDDPEFIRAYATQEDVGPLVDRVEALIANVYELIKELEPVVSAGAEEMFGKSGTELLEMFREGDPNEIDDEVLRKQVEAVQTLPDDLMER